MIRQGVGNRVISIPPGWLTVATPRSAAADAIPWYLSGGISAANCIAAYQPKGAASLAASYINLANPGTYNAAPGVAPTWDTTNGWIFNGSSQFLDTGITPVNDQSWSMIVRFSEFTTGDDTICGLYQGIPPQFRIAMNSAIDKAVYGNANQLAVSPKAASGVFAVVGNKGYRDGIAEAGTIAAGGAAFSLSIYIGCAHYTGPAAVNFFDGNIQALSIYNVAITAQVAAVTTAMNLL